MGKKGWTKEDNPMWAVMRLSHVWHRIIEKQVSDLGLSSIQARILGYLDYQSQKGRKVFQKELEKEFKIRKSSVSSVIQMLEKKGLIRCAAVLEDARLKELELTERGLDIRDKANERFRVLEELVNEAMSPEERRLWFSCIQKIETRLKEAEYD